VAANPIQYSDYLTQDGQALLRSPTHGVSNDKFIGASHKDVPYPSECYLDVLHKASKTLHGVAKTLHNETVRQRRVRARCMICGVKPWRVSVFVHRK
jgi:hypothetical protein